MSITINGDTGIAGVDGSASTPAVQGNDTNTGMFFPASDTIAFAEGGTEVMRIDSNGSVGIGTSSPSSFNAKFVVAGAASGSQVVSSITNTSGTANSQAVLSLNPLNDAFNVRDSQIRATNNGLNQTTLEFYTANAATPAERMRIDSSGNVLINTTSAQNSARMSLAITSATNGMSIVQTDNATQNDKLLFVNTNGIVGYIRTLNSATTYSTSSDYRLKENIAPMTGALNVVAQLKPVTYTWKIDGTDGQGFIAHELQAVVPDCVTGEKDAVDAEGNPIYQGIDTSFLVATLTAAIQEQQAIIEQLKADVEMLKGSK